MDTNKSEWKLEEAAEGVELFHPAGDEMQIEKARDQAEASGWIPEHEPVADVTTPNLRVARARRIELGQAMAGVETAIARPASADGWSSLAETAVAGLRSALAAHIADVEAPDGLLVEILHKAPRLAADIKQIEIEHVDLVGSLDRVEETFEAQGESRPQIIRQAVLSLLGDLALHRQHGSDLVYDAYFVDIAAGD